VGQEREQEAAEPAPPRESIFKRSDEEKRPDSGADRQANRPLRIDP
jgi:hypothetical protein